MIDIIILLGSLIFAITVICAFLITKLPNKNWIKFLLIPLVLSFGCLTFLNIKELMGYPYPGIPSGQFIVEHVRVVGDGQSGSQIEFWALSLKGKSRLYTIPFDSQTLQQFRLSMNANQSGQGIMIMEFGKKLNGDGGGNSNNYQLDGTFTPLQKFLPQKTDNDDQANPLPPQQ